MAELDDFFAKKDKSKKKGKSKITAEDLLAQQESAETIKQKEKKKEKREQSQGSATKSKDDDEWVDFENEKETDYSGLRIQNLQIGKAAAEDQEEQDSENPESEGGENREPSAWSPTDEPPQNPVVEEKPPSPIPKPQTDEAPRPPPGKYVPPSMRGMTSSGASGLSAMRPSHYRRKKVAPNINDSADFPSLGGDTIAPQQGTARGESMTESSNFERVRSGGWNRPVEGNKSIELENRYQSLES